MARLLARTPVRPELSLTGTLSSELSHRRLLNQCVRFATMFSGFSIGWFTSNWSYRVTGCTVKFKIPPDPLNLNTVDCWCEPAIYSIRWVTIIQMGKELHKGLQCSRIVQEDRRPLFRAKPA